MKVIKVIAALGLFLLLINTGWQIASCEFNNILLKDDLKDVAAMEGSRIGMAAPQSDDDLRAALIHKAAQHSMHLVPSQISVRRSGTEDHPVILLAAKYQARVWLPGFALVFHYTATSRG